MSADAQIWIDFVDMATKNKELTSTARDALKRSVAESKHEVDKMAALVTGQSVSMLKTIKDFTKSGL